MPHNEPAEALGITGTRDDAEAPHGVVEGREEASEARVDPAAARIAAYLRLTPGAHTLGGEIAYSEEFRSGDWPRTAYAPTRDDVETLLAELAAYQALDLGDVDGRVSASCGNPDHPTWLRKPDDTRACPWCQVALSEEQTERWRRTAYQVACTHESDETATA